MNRPQATINAASALGAADFCVMMIKYPSLSHAWQLWMKTFVLFWLTRTGNLTDAYRTVVTRPNPFVPLFRAWMMPEPPGLAVLETADRQSTVDCSPNTGGFAPPVVNEWMNEIYLYLRFCVLFFCFECGRLSFFFVGDIYYIQNVIIYFVFVFCIYIYLSWKDCLIGIIEGKRLYFIGQLIM